MHYLGMKYDYFMFIIIAVINRKIYMFRFKHYLEEKSYTQDFSKIVHQIGLM